MNTAIDNVLKFPGPEPGGMPDNRPEYPGKGFALIHRQFMDSKLYKDSQAVHLWLHLILKANHADEPVNTEIGVIMVRRGQMITGRPTLVMETFIPDNKVRSLLRTFEAKGMIKTESKGRKFSLLTIVKYDDFQALNCPTVVQRLSKENTSENAALSDVCPTAVQRLSINNNNILNTNVFNDRPRISNHPVGQTKPIRPESAIQSPKGDKWGTADDLKAAEWIFGKIQIVSATAKTPNWPAWANDIRLMRSALQVTHKRICEVFAWANSDSFWQSNVMSPSKLREKWDTLNVQMSQPGRAKAPVSAQPSQHWNDREAWENEFI